MPVAPQTRYPGVYIQEVPSDVRTITPVDTATAAFVGRAKRGPVHHPTVIHGYADFDRIFGGLWEQSRLGHAVSDFFLNGGSKAVIVRLFATEKKEKAAAKKAAGKEESGEEAAGPGPECAQLAVGGLTLWARHPGSWGNSLEAEVGEIDPKVLQPIADRYGLDDPSQLFNLKVRDAGSGTVEVFQNVTVTEGPRRVDRVVEHESQLVSVGGKLPSKRPAKDSKGAVKTEVGDGADLAAADFTEGEATKQGIYALEDADIFNLLCIPPYVEDDNGGGTDTSVLAAAASYCTKRRAVLIVDPPTDWRTKDEAVDGFPIADLGPSENATVFFPRIRKSNPLHDGQVETFAPCGTIAGVIARTDSLRGVWKAPAGIEATLKGVTSLSVPLTDAENGDLNPLGVNCLRTLPAAGHVVWGARTTAGDDRLASQWKYLPVRRTALFIEESLYRGTQWAVFEPNDEPLWAQLRLNIGSFMHGLFKQGAFQGASPKDAYFVKCDSTTTTQADIDRGTVNVHVGFAPLKPAEFVVIYIQQKAGPLET